MIKLTIKKLIPNNVKNMKIKVRSIWRIIVCTLALPYFHNNFYNKQGQFICIAITTSSNSFKEHD